MQAQKLNSISHTVFISEYQLIQNKNLSRKYSDTFKGSKVYISYKAFFSEHCLLGMHIWNRQKQTNKKAIYNNAELTNIALWCLEAWMLEGENMKA